MLSQSEFLERLWCDVIRAGGDGKWIDAVIERPGSENDKRIAGILSKILERGTTRQEVMDLLQWDRYETVFGTVSIVEEEGVERKAWEGIHEQLLMADPESQDSDATASVVAKPLLEVRRSHRMEFSPDSRKVVAADDGRIWEVATGKELGRCKIPPNTGSARWSPKGDYIAFNNTTGVVRLCDPTTGSKIRDVKYFHETTGVLISSDGAKLVGVDRSDSLFISDAGDGKPICKKSMDDITIECVAADEKSILTYVEMQKQKKAAIIEWDWDLSEKGRHLLDYEYCESCFDMGEKTFLKVKGRQLTAISLTSGKVDHTVTLELPDEGRVKSITAIPGGVCVISDDAFMFFDGRTPKATSHVTIQYAYDATVSPDGRLIALSSWGKGQIWRLEDLLKPCLGA